MARNHWWRYNDKYFSRPFDRRRVRWERFGFVAFLVVLFPFCWYLNLPHWWFFPTVSTILWWTQTMIRIGPRRRRQLVGLLPPDNTVGAKAPDPNSRDRALRAD